MPIFGSHTPNGIGTGPGPFSGGSIGFDNTQGAGQGVNGGHAQAKPATQRGPSSQVIPTVKAITSVKNPEFNVFAIHGLMSSTDTWTNPGSPPFVWLANLPELLPPQVRGKPVQVYLVGWNTNALDPANMSTSIQDTCRPLASTLLGAIGRTPTLARLNSPGKTGQAPFLPSIFIGHSMGGILERALLSFMLQESSAPAAGSEQDQAILGTLPNTDGVENVSSMFLPFLESVAGVILLASPSQGSALAEVGPLAQAISEATGGLTTQINASHVLALMENSPEQQQITAGFNKYCSWYETTTKRKLIVHALRETAPIFPKLLPGVLVVTPESADVEASTKELTETVTRDLKDLSHVQVTHFASGSDPNLTIILESFATIMLSAPGQQAQAVQPLGTAAGPAAGPRGAGPGTAMLPGPSTLRRNVPGASGGAGGIGLTPAGNGGPDPTGSAGGAAFNVGSEA